MAGFHRINGDFVVRTALDVTDEQKVYETGYWVAPKYAGQGMATEATNAAIRYAFGQLGAKAISIGYFDGNEPSRRIVEKLGFQKLRVAHNAATRSRIIPGHPIDPTAGRKQWRYKLSEVDSALSQPHNEARQPQDRKGR